MLYFHMDISIRLLLLVYILVLHGYCYYYIAYLQSVQSLAITCMLWHAPVVHMAIIEVNLYIIYISAAV